MTCVELGMGEMVIKTDTAQCQIKNMILIQSTQVSMIITQVQIGVKFRLFCIHEYTSVKIIVIKLIIIN